MSMAKASGVVIVTLFLTLQLRTVKSEYAMLLTAAAGVLLLLECTRYLEIFVQVIEEWMTEMPVQTPFIRILLKMLGTAYLAQFCGNICRDAGYGGLSSQLEILGKLAILAMGLPFLTQFLEGCRFLLLQGIPA